MAQQRAAFDMNTLIQIVVDATESVKQKIDAIQARGSSISIGDMFDMQMLMNHLSQLSEMSSSVVAAANTSILSMAKNVR